VRFSVDNVLSASFSIVAFAKKKLKYSVFDLTCFCQFGISAISWPICTKFGTINGLLYCDFGNVKKV